MNDEKDILKKADEIEEELDSMINDLIETDEKDQKIKEIIEKNDSRDEYQEVVDRIGEDIEKIDL